MEEYGLGDCKGKTVALSTSVHLTKADGELLDKETYIYTHLVGSLLYLSVCTGPDIAQAVGALSKYMQAPTTVHWQAAKGLLRYVASTQEHGIVFDKDPGLVIGYCDADYAGDLDTRRSTTGFVFILHGGAIAWLSKRQPTVAASTTEAECFAAALAAREALWLRTAGRPWDHDRYIPDQSRQSERSEAAEEPCVIQPLQAHRCGVPLRQRACGKAGAGVQLHQHTGHAGRHVHQASAGQQAADPLRRHWSRVRHRLGLSTLR